MEKKRSARNLKQNRLAELVLRNVIQEQQKPKPLDPLLVQEGGSHYKSMKIQPVEFIEANGIPFLEGNVIKRVCRHSTKNKAEDIRKAIHELQLILKLRYND